MVLERGDIDEVVKEDAEEERDSTDLDGWNFFGWYEKRMTNINILDIGKYGDLDDVWVIFNLENNGKGVLQDFKTKQLKSILF